MTAPRATLALAFVVGLAPTLALAQAQKAGVVTTLEGNVTATRAAAQPVPLRFKDDVFIQDKITTGEQSLARMLLGGKAVVTVRERSVVTITEVPGRSTLEIDSGKFALAVARERMRPGEVIEIRTPNAIAGVRGSVVVTDVESPPGAATPVSSLYVLQGNIEAQPRDPATRAPVGTPRTLNAMEHFRVVGLLPSVNAIRAEQLGAIRSGLQPKDKAHTEAQNQDQVTEQQMQTASALATTLTGTGSVSGLIGPRVTPPQPTTAQASNAAAPLIPVTAEVQSDLGKGVVTGVQTLGGLLVNGGFETGDFRGWTLDGAGSVIRSFGSIGAPEGGFMALIHTRTGVTLAGCSSSTDCTRTTLSQPFVVNSIVTLRGLGAFLSNEFPTQTVPDRYRVQVRDASGALFTLLDVDTNQLRPLFRPISGVVSIGGFTLGIEGTGVADFNLGKQTIVIAPGKATLSISVANVSDTRFDSGFLIDGVLVTQDPPRHFVRGGSLHAGTLLTLSNASEKFDSLLFVCCGGQATLTGPALSANNSGVDAPFSLISVIQGGLLTSYGTGPLVELYHGDYTLGAMTGVFEVAGLSEGDRPLRHSGTFLDAANATVRAGAAMVVDTALVEATAPLLNLRNSTFVSSEHALDLQRKASMTSTGPLFALDRSTLTVQSGALVNLGWGSSLVVNGDLIRLANGSTLNLLNGPLAQLTGNSLLSVGGALFAFSGSGNAVRISNGLCATFGCTTIGGLPFAFTAGASPANVSVRNPVSGTGAIDIAGAAFLISGAGSRVTIGN